MELNSDNRDEVDARQPLRGYLVIHVGGYKMFHDNAGHVYTSGSDTIIAPDRLVEAERHPVGSMLWYEEGWAVGDNPRERFCKWNWFKPMRKFHDFDEAVTYIYRLRQKRKRPNETYSLVYFLKGVGCKDCCEQVSSFEDIARFEKEVAAELEQHIVELESRRQVLRDEYPEFDRLKELFGPRRALSLSGLLKTIRRDGEEKAMQGMAQSTYFRNARELRKLGLIE